MSTASEWSAPSGNPWTGLPHETSSLLDTEEDGNNSEDGEDGVEFSHGSMHIVDGELIIETSESFDEDVDLIAEDFETLLDQIEMASADIEED
jgi:hypothetical protein